ncbi:MAG TPA: hypothetical protein VFH39_00085, partial [Candidatus Saccharimonadales bacterium]|nr:hypothetical protein [Candidatus Saccharimonadales bacterium]
DYCYGKIRTDNQIRLRQQRSFSVPAEVSIQIAMATADEFSVVAVGLDARAVGLVGDKSREADVQRGKLMQRAAELSLFAANINKLCEPEIVARLLQELEQATQE